jgi:hypothetical protein
LTAFKPLYEFTSDPEKLAVVLAEWIAGEMMNSLKPMLSMLNVKERQ